MTLLSDTRPPESSPNSRDRLRLVSWLWVALLAGAVVVLIAAEWPRLEGRFGLQGRRRRERMRRKAKLQVVRTEPDEAEEFAASVERDLSLLPTIDERDERRR